MKLSELKPVSGSKKRMKRIGRGLGSGHGKTSGRGNKGQRARSGGRVLRGFEGGQMPLHRRLPKRGFVNSFAEEYGIVNLEQLEKFDSGTEVTPELMAGNGFVAKRVKVKILGNGKLSKKLTVKAHKFSKSAEEKIKSAGGQTQVI